MLDKKYKKFKGILKYFEMKKLDLLIIIVLFIISLTPNIYYAKADMGKTNSEKYLEIQVQGKIYKRIKISGHKGSEIINIENNNGHVNVVEIKEEYVSMKESDCKDQICVKSRPITNNGETIVCLPNKVVLQIVGGEINDEDINAF